MPSATVPALWNILWGNTGAKTMGEAGAYVRDAARFFDIKQPFAKFKAPVFVNPYMHGSVGSPLLSRY